VRSRVDRAATRRGTRRRRARGLWMGARRYLTAVGGGREAVGRGALEQPAAGKEGAGVGDLVRGRRRGEEARPVEGSSGGGVLAGGAGPGR
jgi:hypothetical protein